MIKIGNHIINNTIFLAPMAGVTDLSFRLICREYGCGFAYTEMVSSKALYYHDKKTKKLLETNEKDHPLGIQIFGQDPEIMSVTLKEIDEFSPNLIDINMGCPAPKIVNNHEGSFLMTDAKKVFEIVSAVKRKSSVPVTVKMRKGFSDNTAVETAKAAEAAGADAICVHPRTRFEYYTGHSDWKVILDVKNAVSIPVIGNGDICCGEDAKNMMDQTGCDAVMIGRAAQGNPFIFREIREYLEYGEVKTKVTAEERIDTAIRQIRMLVAEKGEHTGILQARKHAAWYIKGLRGSAAAKSIINTALSLCQMEDVLQKLL